MENETVPDKPEVWNSVCRQLHLAPLEYRAHLAMNFQLHVVSPADIPNCEFRADKVYTARGGFRYRACTNMLGVVQVLDNVPPMDSLSGRTTPSIAAGDCIMLALTWTHADGYGLGLTGPYNVAVHDTVLMYEGGAWGPEFDVYTWSYVNRDTIAPAPVEPKGPLEQEIREVCNELADLLVRKNKAYGNSVGDPLMVFSKLPWDERMGVRMDDKLSRLARGDCKDEENPELDLAGYIMLKLAIRLKRKRQGLSQ